MISRDPFAPQELCDSVITVMLMHSHNGTHVPCTPHGAGHSSVRILDRQEWSYPISDD